MSETATELQWNLDKLGQWTEPKEFEVTKEMVERRDVSLGASLEKAAS